MMRRLMLSGRVGGRRFPHGQGVAGITTTASRDQLKPSPDPHVATDDECSSYYDTASHYDVLWGKDNIHIGYYPHLATKGALPLDFQQAAVAVTERMCTLGDITHRSRVLDLGCGKGISCKQIAENTGAECVGVDLSPGNIQRAVAMAESRPDLRLSFINGACVCVCACACVCPLAVICSYKLISPVGE
jgi:SAM-dependent methyltransferase